MRNELKNKLFIEFTFTRIGGDFEEVVEQYVCSTQYKLLRIYEFYFDFCRNCVVDKEQGFCRMYINDVEVLSNKIFYKGVI